MITLNLKEIDAVIFDMDGTMVDNDSYHKLAWIEFSKRHGMTLSEKDYKEKISGRKNDQILPELFNNKLSPKEVNKYGKEKEAIYRKIYGKEVKEVAGLKDFIKLLKKKKIRIALATTSNKTNRDFVLKALDLEKAFDVILGYENVVNGKPHPEIYLKTAIKLKVDPSNCFVFEDTNAGTKAAKDAGMKVIGLLTSHTKEELINADAWIQNFKDLKIH